MAISSTEQRKRNIQQKISDVKSASTAIALVTPQAFLERNPPSISPTVEKGTMATQADVNAFWNKAAQLLKPSFKEAVKEELEPVRVDLAEQSIRISSVESKLDSVLEELRKKA